MASLTSNGGATNSGAANSGATKTNSGGNGATKITSRWQVHGGNGQWYDFNDSANSTINTELENGATKITYPYQPPMANTPFTYDLDIYSMTQINNDTSISRRVRCISGIPSKWTRNGTELSDVDGTSISQALAATTSHAQLSSGESINIDLEMAVTPQVLVQQLLVPTITLSEDPDHICPVCLNNTRLTAMLPCGHVVCYGCLPRIIMHNSKCPRCRANFERCQVINLDGPSGRFIDRDKLYWSTE